MDEAVEAAGMELGSVVAAYRSDVYVGHHPAGPQTPQRAPKQPTNPPTHRPTNPPTHRPTDPPTH